MTVTKYSSQSHFENLKIGEQFLLKNTKGYHICEKRKEGFKYISNFVASCLRSKYKLIIANKEYKVLEINKFNNRK